MKTIKALLTERPVDRKDPSKGRRHQLILIREDGVRVELSDTTMPLETMLKLQKLLQD